MTTILAIDPGSERSGWVTYHPEARRVLEHAKTPNADVLTLLRFLPADVTVVVEWLSSYGRPVGAETFETCWWAGRFREAVGLRAHRLTRSAVVAHLIGGPRRKGDPTADAMVWQALVDRFGGIGGAEVAVGRKASPGPLYGIHADMRAALAVAVTFADDPKLATA